MTIWSNDPIYRTEPDPAFQDQGFDPSLPFPVVFLNWKLFDLDTRVGAEETISTDHETRISTLETEVQELEDDWAVEHNADGTHSDVTANTVQVGGGFGDTGATIAANGNISTDGEVVHKAAEGHWALSGRGLYNTYVFDGSGVLNRSQYVVNDTTTRRVYSISNSDASNNIVVSYPVHVPQGALLTKLGMVGFVTNAGGNATATVRLFRTRLDTAFPGGVVTSGGAFITGDGAVEIASVQLDNTGAPANNVSAADTDNIVGETVGGEYAYHVEVDIDNGGDATVAISVSAIWVKHTRTRLGDF